MPVGAATHLDEADNKIKDELKNILTRYAALFPAELPFSVPPDRDMKDVHTIELIEGARPIAKSPYHQGP